MAKAQSFVRMPKLVFRDGGVAKSQGKKSGNLKQSTVRRKFNMPRLFDFYYRYFNIYCLCIYLVLSQVEFNYVHVNRSQAFKTVFLGNSNVGKTCLARLIVDRQIAEQTTNTIGFDHHTKEMELEEGIPVNVRRESGFFVRKEWMEMMRGREKGWDYERERKGAGRERAERERESEHER